MKNSELGSLAKRSWSVTQQFFPSLVSISGRVEDTLRGWDAGRSGLRTKAAFP